MVVRQRTLVPTNKVIVAAMSGAVLTIVAWAMKTFLPHIELPPDVSAAVVTITSFVVSYLVPNEYVEPPTEGGMEHIHAKSKPRSHTK